MSNLGPMRNYPGVQGNLNWMPGYFILLQTSGNSVASDFDLSQCMRFPTMWYARPAKPQISLRIRAV